MWKAPELGPHVSWGRKGSSAVCRNEESVCRPPETLVKKCKDYLHNNVKQSSHPLRKSDFWSEFGPFGEMAPKWLRKSDTLTIGAIVIDYINALRVFQHKQDEYSPLTPSRTPNGPSYMSD